MFNMKLLRVLKGHCDKTEFEKNLQPNASDEYKLGNYQQARDKFNELKTCVWCEIIKSRDKRSAMFLRPYHKDCPKF